MLEGLFGSSARSTMVSRERALAGRDASPYPVPETHAVLGTALQGPWPDGTRVLYLALGCFWGAEKLFWELPGVVTTAAGYQGGYTKFPTYEETCTSLTGHTETVLVAYDPAVVSDEDVLRTFWENHDPTQGKRQGKDVGTTYRSAIYALDDAQKASAESSRDAYQAALTKAGKGKITTEIASAGPFYYAEGYHQGYLAKNPAGYCGIGGTGVVCPIGIGVSA